MDSEKILIRIAERCNADKSVLEEYLDIFVEEMVKSLKRGNDITISGLGDFSIVIADNDKEEKNGLAVRGRKREIKFIPEGKVVEGLNRW